jgi:hypothetical protein
MSYSLHEPGPGQHWPGNCGVGQVERRRDSTARTDHDGKLIAASLRE